MHIGKKTLLNINYYFAHGVEFHIKDNFLLKKFNLTQTNTNGKI